MSLVFGSRCDVCIHVLLKQARHMINTLCVSLFYFLKKGKKNVSNQSVESAGVAFVKGG